LSTKMSSAHRSTDQILGKESVQVQIVQTSQNVTRCTSNFKEAEFFSPFVTESAETSYCQVPVSMTSSILTDLRPACCANNSASFASCSVHCTEDVKWNIHIVPTRTTLSRSKVIFSH
jgi:hypothetical protein